jgi:flavin-dependent thymidylate synthase
MGLEQIQVQLHDVFGDDRRIAASAWTSSYADGRKELKTDEDVERVVRMLGGSKPAHGVPFESVVFYFWLRLPIATDRQFMTHRIQSANGMSGRYRTMPKDFYTLPDDVLKLLERVGCSDRYTQICVDANTFYQAQIGHFKTLKEQGLLGDNEFKRLRETFRGVLPQNNMTERTTCINLRSFANFQKQRNDVHAALEMQDIAQKMLNEVELSGRIPVALEVLKNNGWDL